MLHALAARKCCFIIKFSAAPQREDQPFVLPINTEGDAPFSLTPVIDAVRKHGGINQCE
jgi:hypothetical protein